MLSLLLLLAGCGVEPSEGGGATETGNGLQIKVITYEQAAARAASVRFIRTDTWIRDLASSGSPQTFSAVTDDSGAVHLDSLPPGKWAVQCDWGSQAGIVSIGIDTGRLVLPLQPVSRVRATAVTGLRSYPLRVVGSAWSSVDDPTGNPVLYLPPGSWAVATKVDTSAVAVGTPRVSLRQALDDTVVLDPRRVVLDDFGSGNIYTSFWMYSGFGDWYAVANTGSKIWSASDSTKPSYAGSLSMQYSLSDTISGYAISGISFVAGGTYHSLDLTSMDSLCFDARGSAKLAVGLQHIAPTGAVAKSVLASVGTISAGWTRRCITPASFGTGWDSIRTSGNDLAFVASRGTLLELRNLVLWGVPLQKLVP